MFNQPLLNSSVFTFFYYFTIYSFMGWCLETVYATINKKEFVNRGFLHGPFCPIYGFGCLAIIVLLKPIQSNYFLLFLGSVFLTSTIEYITGYILETAFNSTWWDYSDKRYNLNGKICLSFSIMWGFVSIMILKVVHPYIVSMVILIPIKLGIIVFNITLLYFLVDFITTVITIFKLRSLLAQLNATYLELASKLSDLKLNIESTKDITELKIKLEQLIESAEMRINKKKNDIENIVKELKTKYDSLLIKKSPSYSRLINAFPNLKFKGFDSILKDVKKKIHKDTKI